LLGSIGRLGIVTPSHRHSCEGTGGVTFVSQRQRNRRVTIRRLSLSATPSHINAPSIRGAHLLFENRCAPSQSLFGCAGKQAALGSSVACFRKRSSSSRSSCEQASNSPLVSQPRPPHSLQRERI